MTSSIRRIIPVVGLCLAGATLSAQTPLPIEPPDALNTLALGINKSNEVAGTYWPTAGPSRGFLYADGTYTVIGYPGAAWTWATGVSDKREVVGYYGDGAGSTQSFVWSKGDYRPFAFPGGQDTQAKAVCGRLVVGAYRDATGPHGFLLRDLGGRNPSFQTIDYPGAIETLPTSVGCSGTIVGTYRDGEGSQHAFLRTPEGYYRTIELPAGYSVVWGRVAGDDEGVVAGACYTPSGLSGFVLSSDGFTTYDHPGAWQTSFTGVSRRGVLVGYWFDDQYGHGFVLRP